MAVSTPLLVWPATSDALREILQIESGERLKCHGLAKKTMRRCGRPGAELKSRQVTALLNKVLGLGSLDAARGLLGDLAKLLLCWSHLPKQGHEWITKWEKTLEPLKKAVVVKTEMKEEQDDDDASDLGDLPENDVDTVMTAQDVQMPKVSVENETPIQEITLIDANNHDDGPRTRPSSPTTSKIPPSPSSTSLKSAGPKHIFERYGPLKSTMDLNLGVKNLIIRPLLPKSEIASNGEVYIYTFPTTYRDTRPYLKIGNSGNLDQRMKDWTSLCGYKPRLLTHTGAEHYVKVEKLVHAQLHNQRKRETACPCKKRHKEWFNVTWTDASAAVALWADWMRQEPYDEKGVLREVWKTRLEEMDLSDPGCWTAFVNGEKVDDSGYDSASEDDD